MSRGTGGFHCRAFCAQLLSRVWLCDPIDCSVPGSYVHGVLQAGILGALPCLPPGDLPDPRSQHPSPTSPALQVHSLPLSHRRSLKGLLPPLKSVRQKKRDRERWRRRKRRKRRQRKKEGRLQVAKEGRNYNGVAVKRRHCGPLGRGFSLKIRHPRDSHAMHVSGFSRVRLFAIPWTVARQVPLCKGFSSQEYWTVSPCPPPGDLSDPGIEPASFMSPASAGRFFTTNATWGAPAIHLSWLYFAKYNSIFNKHQILT